MKDDFFSFHTDRAHMGHLKWLVYQGATYFSEVRAGNFLLPGQCLNLAAFTYTLISSNYTNDSNGISNFIATQERQACGSGMSFRDQNNARQLQEQVGVSVTTPP